MRPRITKTAGFTLFELLIVLVVLALIASLAIPAWFDHSGRTLDNAAILVAEDLRAAQNRAAYSGEPLQVVFRADGDGYRVVDDEGRAQPAPLGDGEFARLYSYDGIFRGVKIERVELGEDRAIRFDENGFACEAGSLILSFRGELRLVQIEGGSGAIEIPGLDWVDSGL